MDPAATPSARPARPVRESRSTLYVLGSATMAAMVLGLTFFLLVRGFQWRAALAALRAEPGIEILSVERVGFFKKRLLGLRDPLAPTAESILTKHNIGHHTAEVILTEFHSLNTPYATKREEAEAARFDELRTAVARHDERYYREAKPEISDFEYDALKQELADLEKQFPQFASAESPTQRKTHSANLPTSLGLAQ